MAADDQQAIVEQDVAEANKVAANVKVIKDDCQKVISTTKCRACSMGIFYPIPYNHRFLAN